MKSLLEYGRTNIALEQGKLQGLVYSILVEELPLANGGCSVESYGLHIAQEDGEAQSVEHVTFSYKKIESMASTLLKNRVTPTMLQEIAGDLIE